MSFVAVYGARGALAAATRGTTTRQKFACYMWEGYTTAHKTRVRHMRHARLEAGRVRQNVVSKQRAHSVGSAAAAAGVAPLTRVLSSVISSTMCLASAKTAAVTMPARWCER